MGLVYIYQFEAKDIKRFYDFGLTCYDDVTYNYEEKDGYLNIKIKKHSEVIDKLINNMINLLKELEKQYKKYIEIR